MITRELLGTTMANNVLRKEAAFANRDLSGPAIGARPVLHFPERCLWRVKGGPPSAHLARTAGLFRHELWAGTMMGRLIVPVASSPEDLNGSRAASRRLLHAAEFGTGIEAAIADCVAV
jgi:hypothetical protein